MEKVVDAFRSPALDFVMFHDYNMPDVAPHVIDLIEVGTEYYQKPVVLAEFGVEFRGGDRTFLVDPQHVGLHNGLWSGWFSETPIIPLSWWWDSYVDRHNLWTEYATLSKFATLLNFDVNHIIFKTLMAGNLTISPEVQATCVVRCIYAGDRAALWLKNDDYKWSLMSEGKEPKETGALVQVIPDLVPGHYSIIWFDPQTGQISEKSPEAEVKEDGVMRLSVPTFARDRACFLKRRP